MLRPQFRGIAAKLLTEWSFVRTPIAMRPFLFRAPRLLACRPHRPPRVGSLVARMGRAPLAPLVARTGRPPLGPRMGRAPLAPVR